jgi:hypothetical protein
MYTTGDFVASTKQFNSGDWGPTTAQFMDHITHDLEEKHWFSIFTALSSYSTRIAKEESVKNGASEQLEERVPLPPSDPPSPPRN